MLDCVPKFVTGVEPTTGCSVESVLTGTGISCPDAIIAFLLLDVNTIGREITLKRPVESRARTIASKPNPELKNRLVPPTCGTIPAARLDNVLSAGASRIGTVAPR